MIGTIEFDHRPLVGAGRGEFELTSISVKGDLVGDRCTEDGRDDELLGVGTGSGVNIERDGPIDPALDVAVRIVEAGEVGSTGGKCAVDGERTGNQTGRSDQDRR